MSTLQCRLSSLYLRHSVPPEQHPLKWLTGFQTYVQSEYFQNIIMNISHGMQNEITLTRYRLSIVQELFEAPTCIQKWSGNISSCLLHWFCPVRCPMHYSILLYRYKKYFHDRNWYFLARELLSSDKVWYPTLW